MDSGHGCDIVAAEKDGGGQANRPMPHVSMRETRKLGKIETRKVANAVGVSGTEERGGNQQQAGETLRGRGRGTAKKKISALSAEKGQQYRQGS